MRKKIDKQKEFEKNYGRGNNKNLTTTRIWSKTLDEWKKFAEDQSPFSKPLSIPEALDFGIKKLNKQIEKKLRLKEGVEF